MCMYLFSVTEHQKLSLESYLIKSAKVDFQLCDVNRQRQMENIKRKVLVLAEALNSLLFCVKG